MSTGSALFVGVDVGTTLTKAGIVDFSGREVVHAAVPTVWHREPTGGHARPADLFDAAVAALEQMLALAPPGEIVGVGVTSMAETAVLTGKDGAPLGPAVAWYDVRAAAERDEMRSELGRTNLGAVTGLGTSQIPTIATLRWLVRNVAATRQARSVASVAEWIVAGLGGDRAAEASLASRTGALSIAERAWWPDALAWAGIEPSLFPLLRTAGTSFGRVCNPPRGLDRLAGAVLTVAGHDHLCAAVGIGATGAGQVMDSCGTAEALLRGVARDPGRDLSAGLAFGIEVGCHVVEGSDALIGGLSLGLNLAPVLDRLGLVSRHGRTDLDTPALALDERAMHGLFDAVADEEVAFLRERRAASALEEPAAHSSPESIWWAAVADAVAGSRRLLDGLERLGGAVDEVRVSGGWSRNPLLMHLKATTFPPLVYPVVKEAGIRGAALLSGVAAGYFESATELPQPEIESARRATGPEPVGAQTTTTDGGRT